MQTLLTILLHLLLGIVLLVCYIIKPIDLYINNGLKEDLMPKYVEFLCTLSWGVPILQIPFLSLINRISKSKA
jgi:Na+-driven multidrug efflux pump